MPGTGLATLRPGVHTCYYQINTNTNTNVGLTIGDGIRLRWRFSESKINNTSAYADTLIDGVYRGVNAQLLLTLKETTQGAGAMLWPWGTPSAPVMDGKLGLIGSLSSSIARVLYLVPQASSPAATNPVVVGANTFNFKCYAKLAPDNDLDMLFGPVETDVPVLLDLLLYDDGTYKRLFEWTV